MVMAILKVTFIVIVTIIVTLRARACGCDITEHAFNGHSHSQRDGHFIIKIHFSGHFEEKTMFIVILKVIVIVIVIVIVALRTRGPLT